jgi:hypothetical protein
MVGERIGSLGGSDVGLDHDQVGIVVQVEFLDVLIL